MTLELQTLEDRTLMAGNVSVSVATNGDWIWILGDNNSNQISITSLSDNDMLITGLNGTTINGYSSWRIDYNSYDLSEQIVIGMGGGSDSVTINGLREGHAELNFYGEVGNDYLEVRNSQLADLDVMMGDGNDTAFVVNSWITGRTERSTGYAGNLFVDGGRGNDALYLNSNAVSSTTTMFAGDGDDQLSLYNNTFSGNLYAHAGNGHDRALVQNNRFNGSYASLDMGAGYYDQVWQGGNSGRNLGRFNVERLNWL